MVSHILVLRMYLGSLWRTVSQFSLRTARRKSTRSNIVQNAGVDPESRIIWLDLELSGLSLENDVILEAACVVTEANLEEVGERFDVVIHQALEVLNNMDKWCLETHGKTGLIEEVKRSTVSLKCAEQQLLDYVKKYTLSKKSCLAGNTVYMDRFFLRKYMPTLEDHIHYRIIDVSTVKELCRRWNNEIFVNAPQKTFTHRALDDILESIAELRYYKEAIFDKK